MSGFLNRSGASLFQGRFLDLTSNLPDDVLGDILGDVVHGRAVVIDIDGLIGTTGEPSETSLFDADLEMYVSDDAKGQLAGVDLEVEMMKMTHWSSLLLGSDFDWDDPPLHTIDDIAAWVQSQFGDVIKRLDGKKTSMVDNLVDHGNFLPSFSGHNRNNRRKIPWTEEHKRKVRETRRKSGKSDGHERSYGARRDNSHTLRASIRHATMSDRS
jgi:hypothetical protein